MRPTVLISAAAVLAVSAGVYLWQPESANKPPVAAADGAPVDVALEMAQGLAERSIGVPPNSSSSRLPEFLTWATRADIEDRSACTDGVRKRSQASLEADFDGSVHKNFQFKKIQSMVKDGGTLKDSLGFYYDSASALRLCGDVVAQSPIGGRIPTLFDGTVNDWIQSVRNANADVPASITPFPAGARIATAIWMPLKRNERPRLQLTLPDDSGRKNGDSIVLKVDKATLDGHDCASVVNEENSPFPPIAPGGEDELDLNSLYWVRISKNDKVTRFPCGTIVALMGFHLIEKVANPAAGTSGWLWSTYWWSDKDTKRPRIPVPSSTAHGGDLGVKWQNYVVAASLDSKTALFNPWQESPKSNCAFCHASAIFPIASTTETGPGDLPGHVKDTMSGDFIFAGPIHERRQQ